MSYYKYFKKVDKFISFPVHLLAPEIKTAINRDIQFYHLLNTGLLHSLLSGVMLTLLT